LRGYEHRFLATKQDITECQSPINWVSHSGGNGGGTEPEKRSNVEGPVIETLPFISGNYHSRFSLSRMEKSPRGIKKGDGRISANSGRGNFALLEMILCRDKTKGKKTAPHTN